MTHLRSCSIASLLACACFSDPPSTGDGDDDGTSSTTEPVASTSSTPATDEDSTGVGSSTSETSATAGLDETSASAEAGEVGSEESTGAPSCTCGSDAVLCESFEPPFDPTVLPWAIPTGGGSVEPVLVDTPTTCGAQALRTAVERSDLYSVVNAEVAIDPSALQHLVSTSLWIEPTCLTSPTRAMLVQFPNGGGIWYLFSVWMNESELELRMQNAFSEFTAESAVVPLAPEQWHRLELELSVATEPPQASVFLDGELVIGAFNGPPLSDGVVFEAMQSVNLGIYRDGLPFATPCGVVYDDVQVAAP